MQRKRRPPQGNVRRVTSIGKNIRGVITNKRQRIVQFESEQERKLILMLERDQTVSDYISQPETIEFTVENGRKRQYTPDFQVWRINGQIEWHEVTVSERRSQKATIREREEAATSVCKNRGWRYMVHTEQVLPSGHQYQNLDFLFRFRADIYADKEVMEWWCMQINEPVEVSRKLLTIADPSQRGRYMNVLYHLVWKGAVEIDWEIPLVHQGSINPASHIWQAGGE